MKALRALSVVCVLIVSACSGGQYSTPAGGGGLPPQPKPALVSTSFVFSPPKQSSVGPRRAAYVTANIASVTITLDTVDGAAPPSGLTTSVTTNITLSSCPCTVPGPSVPPGSDTFTITAYDGANGGGSIVSTASATYTIVTGAANSNTITLNGVPSTMAITGIPAATAGSAFSSPQTIIVTVKDADGNTILGTYANAVTLSDSDASGATTITTSGSDTPPAGKLLSSGDAVTLAYTGLAIVPATIGAAATGATSANATFAPALQPIVYTGPFVGSTPEIDLYATSGTGSSGAFTASEAGWTNAPYNKSLNAAAASGCSTIGGVSPSSGTSFTASAAASPSAGTCTITVSDGVGQSKNVTLTYTTSNIGVQ